MRRMMLVTLLAVATACGRGSEEEARQAVRTYLARLVEAYRTSDQSLVDPLVSEQQGLKLVGLIGVKRDAGVVLDAQILELIFLRAAREGDEWVVETRERWYYRDRKIGSGEQVGADSTDAYVMRYRFSRKEGRWILEDLAFVEAPQVGRKTAPMPVDARVLHGIGDAEPPPALAPAAPAKKGTP